MSYFSQLSHRVCEPNGLKTIDLDDRFTRGCGDLFSIWGGGEGMYWALLCTSQETKPGLATKLYWCFVQCNFQGETQCYLPLT